MTGLGLRRGKGIDRKRENRGHIRTKRSETEWGKRCNRPDYAILIVEQDEVTRGEEAEEVDPLGVEHPFPLVVARGATCQQPFEMRPSGIAVGDAQAQKTFAGLVICAVLWCFHAHQILETPCSRRLKRS